MEESMAEVLNLSKDEVLNLLSDDNRKRKTTNIRRISMASSHWHVGPCCLAGGGPPPPATVNRRSGLGSVFLSFFFPTIEGY